MKTISTAILLFLGCTCFAQSQQQIDNQMAFAKFYGYVKYFYPGDDAAKIDWDKFAIYGAKKVDQCKNSNELKDSLNSLAMVLMPGVKIMPSDEQVVFPAGLKPKNLSGYQEITWQHLGVGLVKDKRSIYQSARTNRPLAFNNNLAKMGSFAKMIPASGFDGKEFIFKCKARLLSANVDSKIWVRIDKKDKSMGFLANEAVLNDAWTSIMIKGIVDQNTEKIVVGGLLNGGGAAQFDDFSLFLDGKEIYSNQFDNAVLDSLPKDIKTGASVEGGIGNNYIFSIKQEQANKFIQVNSPVNPNTTFEKPKALFKATAKFGEYIEKPIGNTLKLFVPLVLYGNKENTYPVVDSLQAKHDVSTINNIEYKLFPVSNLYFRLGNLINAWNVFQHFYPYFKVTKTNWESDLSVALQQAYADKTSTDFANTLRVLTAKLKDGHIRVNYPDDMNQFMAPIAWRWVENKLIITAVYNHNVRLKVGDIVTQVDGVDPKKYFQDASKYISAATPGWMNYRLETETLLGRKNTSLNLTVKDSGNNENDFKILRSLTKSAYNLLISKQSAIKFINKDITYISIGTATMKKIDSILPTLKSNKAIICDLRGYPNNNNEFITYLLKEKDTSMHWMQIPKIIYPDQQNVSYNYESWGMKPGKTHLNAKIFFLIDGQAISWAESYLSFIEHYKLATLIGQPTAGTNGDVNRLILQGGFNISFTGLKVVKHNGSQHHGIGIIPNIDVEQTIKAITEGRDEILERAIAEASK